MSENENSTDPTAEKLSPPYLEPQTKGQIADEIAQMAVQKFMRKFWVGLGFLVLVSGTVIKIMVGSMVDTRVKDALAQTERSLDDAKEAVTQAKAYSSIARDTEKETSRIMSEIAIKVDGLSHSVDNLRESNERGAEKFMSDVSSIRSELTDLRELSRSTLASSQEHLTALLAYESDRLSHESGESRRSALSSLAALGKFALPAYDSVSYVTKSEKGEERRLAIHAISRIGPTHENTIPLLKELMDAPDCSFPDLLAIFRAFVAIAPQDDRVIPLLISMGPLKNSPGVRAGAAGQKFAVRT